MIKQLFIFDTETTGVGSTDKIIQMGAIYGKYDTEKHVFHQERIINQFINTDKDIHPEALKVHGISKEKLEPFGYMDKYMMEFMAYINKSDCIVCHNIKFDTRMLEQEMREYSMKNEVKLLDLDEKQHVCTMLGTMDFVNIPGRFGKPKWPSLQELHKKLFGEGFEEAHDALVDITITTKCLLELLKEGVIVL